MSLAFLKNRLIIIFVCAFAGFNSKSADYTRDNLLTYHEKTQMQAFINSKNNSIDVVEHGDGQSPFISFIHPEPVVGASFDTSGKNLLTHGRKSIFLWTIDGSKSITVVPTVKKKLPLQRMQDCAESVSLSFNFNSQGTHFLMYGSEVVSLWSTPSLELLFCQNVIRPEGRQQGGRVESVKWVHEHATEIFPEHGEESPEVEDIKGGFHVSRCLSKPEEKKFLEETIYVPVFDEEGKIIRYELREEFSGDGDTYSTGSSGVVSEQDYKEYSYEQRLKEYLADCTFNEEAKKISSGTKCTNEFSEIGGGEVFVEDGIELAQELRIHNKK